MNRIANKRKGSLDSTLPAKWIWLSQLEVIRKLSMWEHQCSLAALKDIGIRIIKAPLRKSNCKDFLRRCHLHVSSHYWWNSTLWGKTGRGFLTPGWKLYRELAAMPLLKERIGHTDVQERLCNVDLWCWTGSVEAAECVLLHHSLRWMAKVGVMLQEERRKDSLKIRL